MVDQENAAKARMGYFKPVVLSEHASKILNEFAKEAVFEWAMMQGLTVTENGWESPKGWQLPTDPDSVAQMFLPAIEKILSKMKPIEGGASIASEILSRLISEVAWEFIRRVDEGIEGIDNVGDRN